MKSPGPITRAQARAVLAGRSAAAAAHSGLQRPTAPSFRNDVANRAMAVAALRAAPKPGAETNLCRGLDPCITEMPADAAGESRLDGTCTAGQLEAPEPRQGSDSTAADSERDDARICEWDIKVQRTFITVVPRCPQLTHTAARLSMATDLVIATALTANRTSRTGILPRCHYCYHGSLLVCTSFPEFLPPCHHGFYML